MMFQHWFTLEENFQLFIEVYVLQCDVHDFCETFKCLIVKEKDLKILLLNNLHIGFSSKILFSLMFYT
jgi:hypothetical protein